MTTKTVTVAGQGISVDLLRFREYRGDYERITTAQIFALNPGLADLGVILPVGTKVVMPILEGRQAPKEAPVTLWSSSS